MMILIGVLALALGVVIGWLGCSARRALLISRHTRCAVCEGQGCYRDVTAEHMASRGF